MKPLRYRRLVKRGTIGPDVLAIKRALVKAGYDRGIALNPRFGGGLENDLKRFQKHTQLVADGVYGPRTHAKLERYFDAWGRKLFWMPLPKPSVSKVRQRVVDYCWWSVRNERSIHYAQTRPIPSDPWALPKWTDCSGLAKSAYHAAGAPSPDGLGWGDGSTYSFEQHGRRVVSPQPGDYVFYRHPDHVGVYIGNGKVIEHGWEGGPMVNNEWYRTVTDIRSYL